MATQDVSPIIDVENEGELRRVRILAAQQGLWQYDEFTTDWPKDLLLHLAALKRDWFADSYARFEEPYYLQKQVDVTLALYGLTLRGKRVLDFGCGFGASSYCMIKRGADNLVAVDLEGANTAFAEMFFSERRVSQHVDVRNENIVPQLGSEEYDVIWLQAVVEHLLPSEREEYLPRFWDALRMGGVLVVTETPNRLWPKENHTTGGRWFLPWMAPKSVFRRLRRDEKYRDFSDVDFYRSGVIGSTYAEILNHLGRPENCQEMAWQIRRYLPRRYGFARVKRPLLRTCVNAFGYVEPVLESILRRPTQALLPSLDHIAFRKLANVSDKLTDIPGA